MSRPLRAVFYRPPIRNGELYFRFGNYERLLKEMNAQIRVLPPPPKHESLLQKAFLFLPRFFRTLPTFLKADLIVMSPSAYMIWVLLLARVCGCRVILEHYLSYVSHDEIINAYPAWLDRWAFSLISHIVAHTVQMKEEIQSVHRLPGDRVTALYCSVDLNHFRPGLIEDGKQWKEKLGVGNRYVVFYHGMHHLWHGMPTLFESIKLLEQEKDIVFIVLPGDDLPERPNILYIRSELPFDQLPGSLAAADLWISGFERHPRGDRAFSSTMIQAMAMGLPVITSPSPEKERHLTHQKNVFFVDPLNARALADMILHCYNHRGSASLVGSAARALAVSRFNQADDDQKLRQILRNVLRGSWKPLPA